MRILSLKKQNEVMQRAINIILELRRNFPDDSAVDAIDDVFEIVLTVGGREMLEHMTGTTTKKPRRTVRGEIGSGMAKCIDMFDEVVDGFERG